MKRLWEREYILRANDFDKFNHIKPSAVLELFQDAAGQHAEEIGVGFDEMIERSYLWVLTRIKFKMLFSPIKYQKVIVKTWPLVPNKLVYRREYSIENEHGEKLIVGSSEWVVMHSEKRRLIADPNLYPFTEGFHTEMMFEEKFTKVPNFEADGLPRIINAGFSELDVNNHVNNTKYANYVLDANAPSETDILKEFQIDYRKEVLEGNQIGIYSIREDGECLAKGVNDNGEIMFACKMEYEK